MTNLIIAGGTRRERSQTLLGRLEGGAGRRWLVAVPCGLPHDMPDGIHGIGLNDLDGALDAVGRVRPGDTLAVESVDRKNSCSALQRRGPRPGRIEP